MYEHGSRGPQSSAGAQDVASGSVGKRTLTEGYSGAGELDARGGHGGGGMVNDRGTGALIGGAIGAIGGAIVGGIVGGVTRAIGGAVVGGVAGAGIGALVGGDGATATPTPVAVRNGPSHTPINDGDQVGMSIAVAITSSTGNDADMARIQDCEKVSASYNHNGSAVHLAPIVGNTSGFMPGYPGFKDKHAWSRKEALDLVDNHGGAGFFDCQQLDVYTDAAAGVNAPVAIPNSGYIIRYNFIIGGGTLVTLRVEKWGAAATVGAYNAAAGPSGLQSDDVVLRP